MNLRFGNKLFGRYIWAASVKKQSGPGPGPDPSEVKYIHDYVQVIFYNKDGTKTAIFSRDTENNPFNKIEFENIKTGCGSATLNFKQFPSFAEISYGQRIDIYLFADKRPWYSGHVLTRPDSGGTGTDSDRIPAD